MPNTDNLDQFLQEVKAELPDEGNIKIIKKEWPDPKTIAGPFIATHDLMVSDVGTEPFYLPKGSYQFFNLNAFSHNFLQLSYTSVNPVWTKRWMQADAQTGDFVAMQKNPITGESERGNDDRPFNQITINPKRVMSTDCLYNNDLYYVSTYNFEKFNNIYNKYGWVFGSEVVGPNAKGQHPGIKFSFSVVTARKSDAFTPKREFIVVRGDGGLLDNWVFDTTLGRIDFIGTNEVEISSPFEKTFTSTMTVLYNKTPYIPMDGMTVSGLDEVNAVDDNHDIVPAFEIKLADESFVGKVGLEVTPQYSQNPKIYTIGKDGVRYSQRDRASGYMRLVGLNGCPQRTGFDTGHVKVSISACDPYAWGNPAGINVPLANK